MYSIFGDTCACFIYVVSTFLQVTEDFSPIVSRIKATSASLGGPKGEILYAREHEAVWFKGKRFTPTVWAGGPGEEQIKQLKPALDSKGKKVGEEWFTTVKVEDALTRCAFYNNHGIICHCLSKNFQILGILFFNHI